MLADVFSLFAGPLLSGAPEHGGPFVYTGNFI